MNLQEAQKLLSMFQENPYMYGDDKYTAIIVPETLEDRMNYLADLRDGKASINDGHKYSENDKFVLRGVMNKGFNL